MNAKLDSRVYPVTAWRFAVGSSGGDQQVALLQIAYAKDVAALSTSLAVYPSNEATLLSAREGGPFAGCISATANLNAADCALAYHDGDEAVLKAKRDASSTAC